MSALGKYHQLLIKGTGLSAEQLDQILQLSDTKGYSIKEYMDSQEFTTTEDALMGLCERMHVKYIQEIPDNEIAPELVRNLPINYAKQHEVLPYKEEEGELLILCSNPLNTKAIDDLSTLFRKKISKVVATSLKLQEAINRVYEKSTAALEGLDEITDEGVDLDDPVIDLLEAGDDDAPVIKLVNRLLFRAVKEGASDIHIEPYERDMVVRFRIDGVLFDIFRPPKRFQNAITSRIKVMGNLNIAEKRLPQDGRIPIKMAGKDIDIRLSSLPTAFGERIVMRLQDRSQGIRRLEQLGFSEESKDAILKVLQKTYGIFLVTGPTGAGKSTTLYACLDQINTIDKNIITVENPVEQRIHGLGQIQVNEKIGLTFGQGLRSILRQDPNVIMVGEIRDLDTAEVSINASLTGHLVLSTIHTNDSAGVFPRMIDMGCEPFLIATSLLGVVAQRLIRLLCMSCRESYNPSDFELQGMEITRESLAGSTIYKAKGCSDCNHSGYAGRTMIEELMLVTEDIKSLIMKRADGGAIKKLAIENGMKTMRDHGLAKVKDGLTTMEEVLTNTQLDL